MKIFLAIVFFSISAGTATAQDDPPYIYYVSYQHNVFIVERADGTDARAFGADIPDLAKEWVYGPGWSPNGQYFALHFPLTRYPNGGYINPVTDGMIWLDRMWAYESIHWGPNSDQLLLFGIMNTQEDFYPFISIWLMDIQQDKLLATFQFLRARRGPGYNSIDWQDDSVTFLLSEEVFAEANSWQYRITMSNDGTVLKKPVTWEEFREDFVEIDMDFLISEFASPSERYQITAGGTLTDTTTDVVHTFPEPDFGIAEPVNWIVSDVRWHEDENWMMLFYRVTGNFDAGLPRYMVVASADGTVFRELSTCGDASACVGWLPDTVDVDSIPLLESASP